MQHINIKGKASKIYNAGKNKKILHQNLLNPKNPGSKFLQHLHYFFSFQNNITYSIVADAIF